MRIFYGFFLFLVFGFVMIAPKNAVAGSSWASSDHVQARLISGLSRFDSAEPFRAGLQVRLAEGWHAYWRMPGEGGLPPKLDWSGSKNLADAKMFWPVPARYNDFGIDSFGYEGSVLFPLLLTPETSKKPMKLDLSLSIMVCKDICIPQNMELTYSIAAGEQKQSRNVRIIDKSFETLSHQGDRHDLRLDNVVLGPDALVVVAWSDEGFEEADLFVESGSVFLTASPEITVDEKDSRRATMKITAPAEYDNLADELAGRQITLTLIAGDQAIEKEFSF